MSGGHGGNIYLLAEALGKKESDILDFSASINPLGVPATVQTAVTENIKTVCHYPDPDTGSLRLQIAETTGINPDAILCGNGSTELIYLIVRALQPRNVLIPAPTFSEYERAARGQYAPVGENRRDEAHVSYFMLRQEDDFHLHPDEFISAMREGPSGGSKIAFLCNPNNPTGLLTKKEDMLKICDAAKELSCTLVVDEAFMDFCPGHSVMDEVIQNPYLVVLRSLTKIFALSGLRVGYAVLPESLMGRAKSVKEPWTVNSLAQLAGVAALGDQAYLRETFRIIGEEKKALEERFRQLGISFVPSDVNYYLFRTEKAGEIAASLRHKGILVRSCSNFHGLDGSYIRVAVKSRYDNLRLIEELSSCLE